LVAAVVAVSLSLAAPASGQVDGGEPKPDPCASDEAPTGGSCDGATHRCEDGSEPVDGVCPDREAPEPCWDGSEPKEGDCPPKPNPCPDGEDFCEQIRSCPTDNPLPSGSTCEDHVEAAPEVAPVDAAPSPDAGGALFGRPAPIRGGVIVPSRPAAPAPAPPAVAGARARSGPALARTGETTDGLVVGGVFLVTAGALLLAVVRRRPNAT
jgi:hypothetical protein